MKFTQNLFSEDSSCIEETTISKDKKYCRQKQSKNTKERILKEVFKLMLTQNVEKITISVLEKKLNLTRGAIFYYFSNKDEIIEMTVQHYITQINNIFLANPKSVQKSLESYINMLNEELQNFVEWLKKEANILTPNIAFIHFYIQGETHFPFFSEKIHELLTIEEYNLTQTIKNAIKNKEIKEIASPHEIAKIFINMYISILFRTNDITKNTIIDKKFLNQQTKTIYNLLKI